MNVDKIRLWGFPFVKEPKKEPEPIINIIISESNRRRKQWVAYKKHVWSLTEAISHHIPGIEHRGFKKDHIDHIISIWNGFRLGIEADKIADISNLRMLHYKLNLLKGRN